MPLATATRFFTEYFDYNVHGIGYVAASLISLCIGLLVLLKDPKAKISQSFFLITLTGGMWLFGCGMFMLAQLETHAYQWLALDYLAVPFISPSVYYFCVQWTKINNRRYYIHLGFILASILGLIGFFFTKQIFTFRYFPWGRIDFFNSDYPTRGLVFYISTLTLFCVYGILAGWNLFKALKATSSPLQRAQLQNFIIGYLVGYIGIIDFFVTFDVGFYPIGYFTFSGFTLITAYTIVRHRFLDINLVVKRTALIVAIYATLFALLLPVVIPVLNNFLNNSIKNPLPSILALSLGIGLILSLGPLVYAFLVHHSFWLKGHMSQGLAHELKSPLSAILGSLEVLAHRPDGKKAKNWSEHLEIIKKNAERLELFTNDLLNVAKIQEGSVAMDRRNFDMAEVIQDQVESMHSLALSKGLTITTQIPALQPYTGDKEKLAQVISNLLSNAIKFSDHGIISVLLHTKNNNLECVVIDQGAGISAKDLNRVFDRFYQARKGSKGSGIGLTIAKAWVEAHGGKIWAESAGEGKGAKVTITLPI